jgi:hypothetical protein
MSVTSQDAASALVYTGRICRVGATHVDAETAVEVGPPRGERVAKVRDVRGLESGGHLGEVLVRLSRRLHGQTRCLSPVHAVRHCAHPSTHSSPPGATPKSHLHTQPLRHLVHLLERLVAVHGLSWSAEATEAIQRSSSLHGYVSGGLHGQREGLATHQGRLNEVGTHRPQMAGELS